MKVARLLLAQGAQMSLKSELGGNALVFAACNGHLNLVKLFLEEGLAVDDCDKTGLTALIGAVDLGHTHVVKYLLSKGADVDKADTKSNTPAMKAAAKGQTDTLQALISRGANLQKQNVEGENALEIAISNGHHDTIRLMLQTLGGTNYPLTSVSLEIASARKLETMRSLMKTASIMYAHVKPKSEILGEYAWMEWVLRTGGILVKPKAMFNMMNIAISDGHLALVEALLENGADPNMYLWSGTLPLNIAVVNGDLEIVRFLLDHGADPVVSANIVKRPSGPTKDVLLDALSNMKYDKDTCLAILEELLHSGRFNILFGSASNQTAFWKVLESNHWDKELRDQILRMMLDTVSDVNYSCCGDGATLLHHVVRFGEKALVDVLLEKGASMNSRDNERRTPIMIACHFQPTMITYLLERGADLSLRYSDGKGPLHSAVTGGSLEALKVLTTLDHGLGNLEQISEEGWTPLAYALAAGHEEAALFLIEQGANLNHTVGKFGRSMLHFAAAFSHELVFDKIMALSHESIHTRDTVKDATPLLLVRISPSEFHAANRH
ncbi:hypothetical protein N0V94_007656 [Neodidymelliopsis sp. IMI 364377]|nr:hypothetical protein N0V94_007656 [Neodidymelliopsis sp. IMI 364377]